MYHFANVFYKNNLNYDLPIDITWCLILMTLI